MKLIYAIVFFLILFQAQGQIHRGIKELTPYYTELDKLNEQLRSDPRHFSEGYQQLIQVSENKKDSALLSFLYILKGSYHFYLNKRDSAIYYFENASSIAHRNGNFRIENTANIRRVFCDEYEISAFELSRRMEKNFYNSLRFNDTINMIYSLSGLGLFFDRMDSTAKSFMCHSNALHLSQIGKYRFEEAFILNNIGLMKLELGNLDSAYSDFMKGLEIAQELKNERLESHLRENLGYYYLETDSIDKAREEFYYVLNIGDERGFKDLSLSSLTNLASMEQRLGNLDRADSLYSKALEIAKTERLFHAVSPIYLGIVHLYTQTEEIPKALELLDSSLVYAEFSSKMDIQLAYLQLKSNLLEKTGKTQEALDTYREYKSLFDSINEVSNISSIAEMQLRFNDEKKEKQQLRDKNKLMLQIKQNEIDLATFRQRLIFIIAIFVILISGIMIYYYRLKQKNERQFSHTIVNKLEEERGRIARDLHDGVGQSLIILKNKVIRTSNVTDEKNEQLNENFSEIIEEIRSISRSLIPPELKRLGLKKAIENRLNEITSSSDIFVTTEIDDLDKLTIEEHQSLRIYRIIQELTTNTIKHSEATAIRVEALYDPNQLTIIYQDNGKGMDRDKWKSADNSVGLRSIMQRLNYLNGTIKIDRPKKGFKVVMKIQLT
jgi:signal transduction histidine kinase